MFTSSWSLPIPIPLHIAALLLFAIGLAHSYLGERFILIRLFRRGELPKLHGSSDYTAKILRFAWHLTTLAWWGFAAILIHMARGPVSSRVLGLILGATFGVTGLVTLAISRGRHLAWPLFLAVAVIAVLAAAG